MFLRAISCIGSASLPSVFPTVFYMNLQARLLIKPLALDSALSTKRLLESVVEGNDELPESEFNLERRKLLGKMAAKIEKLLTHVNAISQVKIKILVEILCRLSLLNESQVEEYQKLHLRISEILAEKVEMNQSSHVPSQLANHASARFYEEKINENVRNTRKLLEETHDFIERFKLRVVSVKASAPG